MIEPLVDFKARILCLSSRTPIPVLIDRLLRLQSASQWREPITLYLLGADDEGGPPQRTLSALEFLTLYSVLRLVHSEIRGIALGLIRGYEPLVLAACRKGRRHLLPTAMACIGPLEIGDLPLSNTVVGLARQPGLSLRDEAKALVRAQLDQILLELNLNPSISQAPRVLTAEATIEMGLADSIVPIAALSKQPERDHAPER